VYFVVMLIIIPRASPLKVVDEEECSVAPSYGSRKPEKGMESRDPYTRGVSQAREIEKQLAQQEDKEKGIIRSLLQKGGELLWVLPRDGAMVVMIIMYYMC